MFILFSDCETGFSSRSKHVSFRCTNDHPIAPLKLWKLASAVYTGLLSLLLYYKREWRHNNNNNNNNKHICKAPKGRNFGGAGGSRLCVLVIGLTK